MRTISAIAALILVAGSCVAFKPGSTGYSATWLSVLGVSGAFTPASIDNLEAWWDAADASTVWEDAARTVNATNGGVVLGWSDKSGNNRNLIKSASGDIFYLESEKNGNNVIDLRETAVLRLTNGLDIARNISEITIIMVQRWNGVGGTEMPFSISVGPNINYRQQFRSVAGILWAGARRLDTDGGQSISGGVLSTNEYFAQTARTDYQNQLHELWYNDTATASNTTLQTAGNTSDTDSSFVGLGGNTTGGGSPWDGWVAEVLVYQRALTDEELSQLWTYLENKWGYN